MSSSCDFSIDKYSVLSQKERVVPDIMPMFREPDKKVYLKIGEDGENIVVCEYSNTVSCIVQRLNTLGYSLENIKTQFKTGKENIVNEFKESYLEEDLEESFYKEEKKKIDILESSSFEDWIEAFKDIRERDLSEVYSWGSDEYFDESHSPLVRFILRNDDFSSFYNFPGGVLLSVIRLFLESCPEDKLVKLDISDLVSGGWYELGQAVCDETLSEMKAYYPINEKVVILTEGSTDRFVLEKSLELLFPHMVGYYSFMDFNSSNAAGGAPSLVASIRSFVGSGISNRIIAIFDNDTAAKSAIGPLKKTKLPPNINVLQYPNIDIAKNYPALGPNGIINTDVNGLACSIELYLGRDVLTEDKSLIPIQWKGYDTAVKQYQGEVLDKRGVIERFEKKLEDNKKESPNSLKGDWDELRLLWGEIFKTFQ